MAKEIHVRFGSKVPVDVRSIIEAYNISIHEEELEGTVSGILMINEKTTNLVINNNHHWSRQRFTLAHELGHFLLHKDTATVFIDESPLFFRDLKSAHSINQKEVEANAFAAELLMPESVLKEEFKDSLLDVNDDVAVRSMATKYGVSPPALTIRLTRLGFIS